MLKTPVRAHLFAQAVLLTLLLWVETTAYGTTCAVGGSVSLSVAGLVVIEPALRRIVG